MKRWVFGGEGSRSGLQLRRVTSVDVSKLRSLVGNRVPASTVGPRLCGRWSAVECPRVRSGCRWSVVECPRVRSGLVPSAIASITPSPKASLTTSSILAHGLAHGRTDSLSHAQRRRRQPRRRSRPQTRRRASGCTRHGATIFASCGIHRPASTDGPTFTEGNEC